jgi:hypothetical protein
MTWLTGKRGLVRASLAITSQRAKRFNRVCPECSRTSE